MDAGFIPSSTEQGGLRNKFKVTLGHLKHIFSNDNMEDRIKTIIGEYGSIRAYKNKLYDQEKKINTAISKLEEQLKEEDKKEDDKKEEDNSSKIKDAIKSHKSNLKGIKKELKRVDEYVSDPTIAEFLKRPFSKEEILDLPAVLRSVMLSEKALGKYSAEQQAVIRELVDDLKNSKDENGVSLYDKIIDRGKIALNTAPLMANEVKLMSGQTSFNMVVENAKNDAKRYIAKKRYEAISQISDYNEFVTAMNYMLYYGDAVERNTILTAFRQEESNNSDSEESFFSRYNRERVQSGLLHTKLLYSSKYSDLSTNDKRIISHLIDFMLHSGKDITKPEDVSEVIEDSSFIDYINSVTKDASKSNKIDTSNIETVIKQLQDIIQDANTEVALTSQTKPKIDKGTSAVSDKSDPFVEVNPENEQKNEKSDIGTNEDNNDNSNEETPTNEINSENSNILSGLLKPWYENHVISKILNKFRSKGIFIDRNSVNSEDLTDVENTESSIIDIIKNVLEGHTNDFSEGGSLDKLEDLTYFVEQERKKIDKEISEDKKLTAERKKELKDKKIILQTIIGTLNDTYNELSTEAEQRASNAQQRALKTLQTAQEEGGTEVVTAVLFEDQQPDDPIDGRGTASVSLMSLYREFSPNKNSEIYNPLLEFATTYEIPRYLNNALGEKGTINSNTDILFVYDSNLARKCQEKGMEIPLIAVVEDPNGKYKIGNKFYQPIALYQKNEDDTTQQWITEMMQYTNTEEERSIAKNKDGEIKAHMKYTDENYLYVADNENFSPILGNDRSIIDLVVFESEKAKGRFTTDQLSQYNETRGKSKQEIRNTELYRQLKNAFFKSLKVEKFTDPETGITSPRSYLTYILPNGEKCIIGAKDIRYTTGRDSESTLEQVIERKDFEELGNFNSITQSVASAVLRRLTRDDLLNYNTTEVKKKINKALKTFVYINDSELELDLDMSNNKLVILLNTKIIDDDGKKSYTKKPLLSVNMHVDNGDIKGIDSQLTDSQKGEFFYNLVTDSDGKVWMNEGGFTYVKWEIDYEKWAQYEDYKSKRSDIAYTVSSMFDDGIITTVNSENKLGVQSVFSQNTRLDLRNSGLTTQSQQRATNADLAQPKRPTKSSTVTTKPVTTSSGEIVDPQTGQSENPNKSNTPGSALPVNTTKDEVINKVRDLQRESQRMESTKGKKTGEREVYVTELKNAARALQQGENPTDFSSSPYYLPSTTLGDIADYFLRDVFGFDFDRPYSEFISSGKVNRSSVPPNMTIDSAQKFYDAVNKWKKSKQGHTFFTHNLKIRGTITLTDEDGNKHTVPVRGELDMISVDEQGHLHLYDFKTNREGTTAGKTEGWKNQLLIYKALLEQQGFTVASINILSTNVSYPDPRTGEYKIEEKNGKEKKYGNGHLKKLQFKGSTKKRFSAVDMRPIFMGVVEGIDVEDLNLSWETALSLGIVNDELEIKSPTNSTDSIEKAKNFEEDPEIATITEEEIAKEADPDNFSSLDPTMQERLLAFMGELVEEDQGYETGTEENKAVVKNWWNNADSKMRNEYLKQCHL